MAECFRDCAVAKHSTLSTASFAVATSCPVQLCKVDYPEEAKKAAMKLPSEPAATALKVLERSCG